MHKLWGRANTHGSVTDSFLGIDRIHTIKAEVFQAHYEKNCLNVSGTILIYNIETLIFDGFLTDNGIDLQKVFLLLYDGPKYMIGSNLIQIGLQWF